MSSRHYHLRWSDHGVNMIGVLGGLLASGGSAALSDVTLACSDGSIRTHRVVLASSSKYFMVRVFWGS